MKLGQQALRSLGISLACWLAAGSLVAMVHRLVEPRVQAAQAQQALLPVLEILGTQAFDNDLLASRTPFLADEIQALGLTTHGFFYVASLNQVPQALLLPVTSQEGYGGAIQLLVGLRLNGQVLGVRVLQHRESAGFGEQIETRHGPWVLSLAGKTLLDTRWAIRQDAGDIDQIAGATITSRAMTAGLGNLQGFWRDHRSQLIERWRKQQGTAP